jgi:signal peptidase II
LHKEIKRPWRLLAIVTLIGLFLDLWTKQLAAHALADGRTVRCIGDVLQLVLTYNRAAVFGIDPGHLIPGFSVGKVFPFFNLIAAVLLIVYYRFLRPTDRFLHWALAFILPGALGNMFDRLFHHGRGVVDFIKVDLGFPPFNPWPIFNVADSWVTIGIVLMIASFLFEGERRKHAQPNTPAPTETH